MPKPVIAADPKYTYKVLSKALTNAPFSESFGMKPVLILGDR